jgi:hypothetical protein
MAHCEQVQERLKSSNLPPNPKRGFMTILHHFRDKPARVPNLVCRDVINEIEVCDKDRIGDLYKTVFKNLIDV